MTSPAASGQHLSKFEKRAKIPHPTALFAFNLMQCQRGLQISRAKNIVNVFELSSVAFRLAPPYGGFLVSFCTPKGALKVERNCKGK